MSKITDIKYQKNKDRVNIYLDGAFFCGLQTETLLKSGLKIGSFVDEKKLTKIQTDSDIDKAFEKALSLIERKLYFERELRNKLKEKGYVEDTIALVIAKLKDYNYINDDLLVKNYVNYEKKRSKKDLSYRLKQKGVSDYIISKYIDTIDDDSEYARCEQVAEKYASKKEKTIENKNKTIKYLMGKGFSFEDSKRAANKIFFIGDDYYD